MNGLVEQRHPQGELFAIKQVEIDGIPMGVLNDGTPYLTARGLARMCGIDNSVLIRMANNWSEEQAKPRGRKISELLVAQGFTGTALNLRNIASGEHAYTDAVCMAILEYYAFEGGQGANETALRNYRILARSSFRAFIYKGCNYDPAAAIPDSWKVFHERILLNDQIPRGYFSVFREIADLVVHLIRTGCPFDGHTVPDISVGQTWANHWRANALDGTYGERQKHGHIFPDTFPQAAVNPVEAWIYPTAALGEFRGWLEENYVPQKFPKYIQNKVANGTFLPASAKQLIDAVARPMLTKQ
ncbi:hypothetical protein [Lysobacter sp. GCM10012299]|uniref:hypothetical protein n=1 Tax=Lysobacter sp. GCM10012299 TaxID=3317333 RepID=UPI00361D9382